VSDVLPLNEVGTGPFIGAWRPNHLSGNAAVQAARLKFDIAYFRVFAAFVFVGQWMVARPPA